MTKKEIYVHVWHDEKCDKTVYHIHDNPEYTVFFWRHRETDFEKIEGNKVDVFYTGGDGVTQEDIVQIALPFLKADYPHLVKQDYPRLVK